MDWQFGCAAPIYGSVRVPRRCSCGVADRRDPAAPPQGVWGGLCRNRVSHSIWGPFRFYIHLNSWQNITRLTEEAKVFRTSGISTEFSAYICTLVRYPLQDIRCSWQISLTIYTHMQGQFKLTYIFTISQYIEVCWKSFPNSLRPLMSFKSHQNPVCVSHISDCVVSTCKNTA